MKMTIVEQLGKFSVDTAFSALPADIVEECKRLLLDSIGCALAAVDHPKGKIGIQYGEMLGGGSAEATIIGHPRKSTVNGAAFANGELINALDHDAILPPGHVSPYVVPGILGLGERNEASGADIIRALAVSHEMSFRIGKAMDYLRDTKDGAVATPPVYGFSSTVFGATAAISMLNGWSGEVAAHALGIAGCILPVQSMMALFHHAPSSTIKYLLAGALTQSAMTAAHMAQLGHRGDLHVLDDAEYGFPRFIGTRRWEPDRITENLGSEWRFSKEQSYKPYPHCRILHALLDCLTKIVEENDIKPAEISAIEVWVEGFVERPIWLNRTIECVYDGQFSIAHGIALCAHRVVPGKDWQDPKWVFDPSVLQLMDKVAHKVHPNYVEMLSSNNASRPARVELTARGRTFVEESRYPKGSPSPEPSSYMTWDQLVTKFRHNAAGAIPERTIDEVVDAIRDLENVDNFRSVMEKLGAQAS
jgi:2-methylcitrate dehydratase PrpD